LLSFSRQRLPVEGYDREFPGRVAGDQLSAPGRIADLQVGPHGIDREAI